MAQAERAPAPDPAAAPHSAAMASREYDGGTPRSCQQGCFQVVPAAVRANARAAQAAIQPGRAAARTASSKSSNQPCRSCQQGCPATCSSDTSLAAGSVAGACRMGCCRGRQRQAEPPAPAAPAARQLLPGGRRAGGRGLGGRERVQPALLSGAASGSRHLSESHPAGPASISSPRSYFCSARKKSAQTRRCSPSPTIRA